MSSAYSTHQIPQRHPRTRIRYQTTFRTIPFVLNITIGVFKLTRLPFVRFLRTTQGFLSVQLMRTQSSHHVSAIRSIAYHQLPLHLAFQSNTACSHCRRHGAFWKRLKSHQRNVLAIPLIRNHQLPLCLVTPSNTASPHCHHHSTPKQRFQTQI
jgi:hypothetical protein